MATTGHLAAGLAAGRLSGGSGRTLLAVMLWLTFVSFLPDADVIAFKFGIPYTDPFGHRGFTHSLFFAACFGGLTALVWRGLGRASAVKLGILTAVACASHGLLDMLTDGGEGIAIFWPFTDDRYFAMWRPIPVAPIGPRVLSEWGARVIATEIAFFFPLLAFALWPRRKKRKIFAS
jgi:inner membrane protein